MGSDKSRLPERDSLGWLASSSMAPQKRKEIEGVSNSSLVNLQAQLFQSQATARQRKSGTVDVSDRHVRRKVGIDVSEVLGRSNSGVAERDKRDRLQLKTTDDKAAESYAALERKAALYEKLRRGDAEDAEEQYEVDFLHKGMLSEEQPQPSSWQRSETAPDTSLLAVKGTGGMVTADMERERERRRWEDEAAARLESEWQEDERRRHHKETIHELEEATREGRERAARVRARKEEAQEARRERLKQEFLRRQVQKLKGKAGGSGSSSGKA